MDRGILSSIPCLYYVYLSPHHLTPLAHITFTSHLGCYILSSSSSSLLYPLIVVMKSPTSLTTLSFLLPHQPLSPTDLYSSSSSSALSNQSNMEMKKRDCICERETTTKEEEFKEDSIHTIVFTAGTFLLMVCLKHFLVEKWRAWIFLILNVILLAILFMSMSSQSESNVEEVKNENNKEKKRACVCFSQEIEEGKECYQKQCWNVQNESTEEVVVEEEEEEEEEEEHVLMLSKEELNERVEAFIARFRQHLISDVKQATNLTPNKIEVPCC